MKKNFIFKFLNLSLLVGSIHMSAADPYVVHFESKRAIKFWQVVPIVGKTGDAKEVISLLKNSGDLKKAGYQLVHTFNHYAYVNGNPPGGTSNNATVIQPLPGSILIGSSEHGWASCGLGSGNKFYTGGKGGITRHLACDILK